MISNLNQRDKEILYENKSIDFSSLEYAYIGGKFGTSDLDYVEVLLYDRNDNLIETSIVVRSDYVINNNDDVELKTGTILRKLGYDRGRFRVKYKFLRKVAGSDETILLDKDNKIYDKDFTVTEGGQILDTNGDNLSIKENKYVIHEISPTRTEVRVIAQNISDAEYNENLIQTGIESKKINLPNISVKFGEKNNKNVDQLQNTKILETSEPLDKNFIGSILYLNNSFISEIIPPVPSFEDSNPTDEVESSDVKARWVISDISGATLTQGSIGYINNMWSVFNTLSDNEKEILRSIEQRGFQPNNGLYQKYKNTIDGPRPFFDFNSIIKLKSVSSKPNVSTKYTWKISGRDYRGDKSRSFQNQVYGSDDVQITGGRNNTFFQETSSEGSEIELKLSGADTHISVQLNIECKLGDGQIVKDFVYIPYCIRTNR